MKSRCQEIVEIGDRLFSKRSRTLNLWQETALHFYPERADFTTNLQLGDEYAAHLMTGAPSLMRRDLANTLSAMLRPRDKPWFRARTHSDEINEDPEAKAFLDEMSDIMRRAMYAPHSQFIRATKEGDNDFATFGQAIISTDPRRDLDGLLYRTWHLRDVVWCQNEELEIDAVHRNWCLTAKDLARLFPKTVAPAVNEAVKKDPYCEIKCRHVVLPADQYDYQPDPSSLNKRKLPFISLYLDIENQTILEEKPVKRLGYTIPRWATVSGSQYAHSPATVIALPDARLLQQITLTLLEAGQKVVDPPSVGTMEAIQGPLQLFAGGHTWVDQEYDERAGEALRYLQIDPSGLRWGGEREKIVMEAIKAALFLNQIDVPYPEGDMTATEYRGRVEQYVLRALPLFEPMEVEYNGGICEATFQLMLDMHMFGDLFTDMPEILANQDIRWSFDSPMQSATERGKSQAFIQSAELLKIATEIDPDSRYDFDVGAAFRDALSGTAARADWVVPEEEADARKAQAAQMAQAQQQIASMAAMAQTATAAGEAGQSVGLGAQSLQEAGLV
jgi:hypothetical protein